MIKIINKTTNTDIDENEIADYYSRLHSFFESFPNFRPGSRRKTSYYTSYTAGRSIDLNTGYDWLETTDLSKFSFTPAQQKIFDNFGIGLYNRNLGISGHCIHYLIKKIIDQKFNVWIFLFHINDEYDDMNVNIVVMDQDDMETLRRCRNANDRKEFLIR